MTNTEESILLAVVAPHILGMLLTMLLAVVRINPLIRARVSATGRAVGNEFVVGYLIWNGIKAAAWPLTLALWLGFGRPARRLFTTPSIS